MKLSDWLRLPIEQREAHIDLTTPCELRVTQPYHGFPGGQEMRPHKSEQLAFHGLEDDVPSWRGKVHRCHLCDHGHRNGFCSNPRHIRLGTPSENERDKPLETIRRVSSLGHAGRKRLGRGNRPGRGGYKTQALRVISTIDGYFGTPASVGAHHRPWKLKKSERQMKVPDQDISAFETLTPLQRMMAMEMAS